MGRAKGKYIEDHERGFISGTETFVCEEHFNDMDIKKFIQIKGNSFEQCSFCSQNSVESQENKVTIHFDMLLEGITACIKRSYDDPANGLAYETAEGGYMGRTYDTYELLNDIIGLDADYEILKYIANQISQETWTEKEFYGNTYNEELSLTWNEFSFLVRNKVRYLFNEVSIGLSENKENDKPLDILKTIAEFIIELNLFTAFPENTNLYNQSNVLYRARQHSIIDEVKECKDICSPPNQLAGANRFSPEGISMFYGAENKKTAIEEIIDRNYPNNYITVAEFISTRPLVLIDLRNKSTIGFFDFINIDQYESSQFLLSFIHEVSKKFDSTQNKRIEFVPCQVVTEYFKHILPTKYGQQIDGLVYKSAQNNGSDCYVIFSDSSKCSDEKKLQDDTLLMLKMGSIKTNLVGKS